TAARRSTVAAPPRDGSGRRRRTGPAAGAPWPPWPPTPRPGLTSKKRPKTAFIARKAAAIPQGGDRGPAVRQVVPLPFALPARRRRHDSALPFVILWSAHG